jgi:hypothetical protein
MERWAFSWSAHGVVLGRKWTDRDKFVQQRHSAGLPEATSKTNQRRGESRAKDCGEAGVRDAGSIGAYQIQQTALLAAACRVRRPGQALFKMLYPDNDGQGPDQNA